MDRTTPNEEAAAFNLTATANGGNEFGDLLSKYQNIATLFWKDGWFKAVSSADRLRREALKNGEKGKKEIEGLSFVTPLDLRLCSC
ncbi:hypothetical protein V6N13_125277 [Hibiscus sabdariffa]